MEDNGQIPGAAVPAGIPLRKKKDDANIHISPAMRAALKALGKKGEKYEDVLVKLVRVYEEVNPTREPAVRAVMWGTGHLDPAAVVAGERQQ